MLRRSLQALRSWFPPQLKQLLFTLWQQTTSHNGLGTDEIWIDWLIEQGLTSPPTHYTPILSGRQFYRSKDPTNNIKLVKEDIHKHNSAYIFQQKIPQIIKLVWLKTEHRTHTNNGTLRLQQVLSHKKKHKSTNTPQVFQMSTKAPVREWQYHVMLLVNRTFLGSNIIPDLIISHTELHTLW